MHQLVGQAPALRDYADRNAEIRESLKHVSERLTQARAVQQTLRAQQAEVSEARKNAEQILAIGRISDESGRLLRELQGSLVANELLESRIASREDAIVDVQMKRLEIRQELGALQPADRAAKHYLDENAHAGTDANRTLMMTLIEKRHAALSDLDKTQGQFITVLAEAKALDSQLMQGSAQLRTLLDEHLLWLPSAVPLGSVWLHQLGSGVAWLLAPSNWSGISSAIAAALRTQWFRALLWLAVLVALFVSRRRLALSLAADIGSTGRLSQRQFPAHPGGLHRDRAFDLDLAAGDCCSGLGAAFFR